MTVFPPDKELRSAVVPFFFTVVAAGGYLEPERLRAAVRAALGRAAVALLRTVDALPLRGVRQAGSGSRARLLAAAPAAPPVG